MVIPRIPRTLVLTLVSLAVCGGAFGAEDPAPPAKSVEYKRADANFYARGDVLRSDPGAVILPSTAFAQNGDSYTFVPKKKAPGVIYLETSSDWVEPITPPTMPGASPAALNIAPDAMQVREPRGDVQAAMPGAPTAFTPVTNGMTLPNGAVIKTGANSTAAILFGGVDSARLMPNSEAAVQQTVTATARSAEVDLTVGGVFSKVGTQIGVTSDFQVHAPPYGNAIAPAGDFAALITGNRLDVWAEQGAVELLQPDGRKVGSVSGDGTGPLKLIRFPAIADSAQSLQADSDSLTAILNFIPVADQKIAALRAKAAAGTPLTVTEEAYLARIKHVPALLKLALVAPVPAEVTVLADGTAAFQGTTIGLAELGAKLKDYAANAYEPAVNVKVGPGATYAGFQATLKICKEANVPHVVTVGPVPTPPLPPPPPPKPPAPPEPLVVIAHADGTIKFKGALMKIDEFRDKIKAAIAAAPDAPVTIHSNPTMDYAKFEAVVDACKTASAKTLNIVAPAPQPPPAPRVPPLATPQLAVQPPPPAKPAAELVVPAAPEPLVVTVHADGTIKTLGKTMKIDEFTAKIKAAVAVRPDLAVIIHSNPKMDYGKFEAVVEACKAAPAKEVDVVPPAPEPPKPPPPPAPPKPVEPATALVHEDGSVGFLGTRGTLAEFKTKLAAVVKATPAREIVVKTSSTKVAYAHVKTVLDACADAHVAHVTAPPPPPVVAVTPPAASAAPATPAKPAIAGAPPAPKPAPAPVNTKPVPAEIDLAADGSLTLEGSAVTEDELKAALAEIKKSNPKNPLVMMKQPGVTKEQWMHYVDLCHSLGLKLLVKNAKATALAAKPKAEAAPTLRPAAAEGGSTVPPPAPAPHLAATPAPEEVKPNTAASGTQAPAEEPVPVEIELTADGQVSFLGEVVTESELKSRLSGVAEANADEPVVIVKDEKVTHGQWQHVVDLVHAAKLKAKLKTVKSADSGALKPRAQPGIALQPAPAPEKTAPGAPRILPVEIGLAPKGRLTFEGQPVTLDELEARLTTIAKGNPNQPVVIVKKSDVPQDSVDALVALCQGVSARLKISVKQEPAFTPPSLPDNYPAQNLPALEVPMHASLDALNTSPPASVP
jgi:biopolymer transport protein ExbD